MNPEEIEYPPLASLPKDEDGVVFNAPWEAKVFAIIVLLHQRGHFQWHEWAETLGAEIAADKRSGGNGTGERYYELWLTAAEKLLAQKEICLADELAAAQAALRAPHDHSH